MASNKELSDKVDELQIALDEEQVAVAAAIQVLQDTIVALQAQLADGGSEAERQAILDKLNVVLTDLRGTVA